MAYGIRVKQKELHRLRIEYLGTEGTTVFKGQDVFQELVAK